MIINIRGTSGSGKTYAVRELMREFGGSWPVLIDNKGKGIAQFKYCKMSDYEDWQPVHILGDYTSSLCGGCDTISSHNMISSLVRHFSQFGHVIFEGMTISRSYARFAALDDEMTASGEKYIWAILDTPLDLCLERVQQRRDERDETKKFNPEKTIDTDKRVRRCRQRALQDGRTVVDLHHENTTAQLMQLFIDDDQFDFSKSYREESFR